MVFVWAGPEMRPPWFSPLPRPWPQPTRMSPQGCRWAPGAPPALFLLKLCSGSVSTPSCSSWRATASPTDVFWGRSGQVSALSQLWPQRPLTWHRPCPCVHPPPQNHDLQPSSLHDFPRIPLPPCLCLAAWCPNSGSGVPVHAQRGGLRFRHQEPGLHTGRSAHTRVCPASAEPWVVWGRCFWEEV